MFFGFIAANCQDSQLPLLTDAHLVGTCAASPVAAEVQFDGASTYCACAAIVSLAYVYAPTPNVVNLLFLSLPTTLYFLPRYCSLGSRRGLRFDPCLSLSK